MNKLNGGYIMIDGTSATLQADLKIAYETGKPVLYYENGKAEFATIKKGANKYIVFAGVNNYIELTGTDQNDDEFFLYLDCNIRNKQDLSLECISDMGVVIQMGSGEDTSYAGELINAIGGLFFGSGGIITSKGSNNNVQYTDFDLTDATNVQFN